MLELVELLQANEPVPHDLHHARCKSLWLKPAVLQPSSQFTGRFSWRVRRALSPASPRSNLHGESLRTSTLLVDAPNTGQEGADGLRNGNKSAVRDH